MEPVLQLVLRLFLDLQIHLDSRLQKLTSCAFHLFNPMTLLML